MPHCCVLEEDLNRQRSILVISSIFVLGFVLLGSHALPAYATYATHSSQDLIWSPKEKPLISNVIEGNSVSFSKTIMTDYSWGTSTVTAMLLVDCVSGCKSFEPVSKTLYASVSQSTATTVKYNFEFNEPGTYELSFIIDPLDKIEETDKNNNIVKHEVVVHSSSIWNITVR